MKLDYCGHAGIDLESLPARGAWIEITVYGWVDTADMSLPARGAWIEMSIAWLDAHVVEGSLPARGAWIEIMEYREKPPRWPCRSPHGERGLKCCGIAEYNGDGGVAPRTGSVD